MFFSRGRCPHRPARYDVRAVRKNGHVNIVGFPIGPYGKNFPGGTRKGTWGDLTPMRTELLSET